MTHVFDNVTDVWLNGEGSGPSHAPNTATYGKE